MLILVAAIPAVTNVTNTAAAAVCVDMTTVRCIVDIFFPITAAAAAAGDVCACDGRSLRTFRNEFLVSILLVETFVHINTATSANATTNTTTTSTAAAAAAAAF
jgi:hypothetical protein